MPKQILTDVPACSARAPGRRMARLGLSLAFAALGLSGCAHQQSKPKQVPFEELQARLAGRYDNAAQARSDAQAGVADPHSALDLLIAPARAALIGPATFYVRQTAADDPRRVLSQRIWVLGRTKELAKDKDKKIHPEYIEQHIYVFKEPQRWANVADEPELLQSLEPEDLRQLSGCELLWSKDDSGFEAHRKSQSCDPGSHSQGLLLEQRIELRDNQLAVVDQQVGPDGLLALSGSQEDPFYRFVRRGDAN